MSSQKKLNDQAFNIWKNTNHEYNRDGTRKAYLNAVKKYNQSLLVRIGLKSKRQING